MVRKITLATCSLSQWALDFEGNIKRILQSIQIAKEKGAKYRLGPELEISGYGCNDHFNEMDTFEHSLEVLYCLLKHSACEDIICDVGMPIIHNGLSYNCRVIFYNHKILYIRPKMSMANDGNYREMRWFAPWGKKNYIEPHQLNQELASFTGQKEVPFGDALLAFRDATFCSEICEEMYTAVNPSVAHCLNGAEVITNSSASHHRLRFLNERMDLILNTTSKLGGVYMFSNVCGCDGERVYYDGCSLISSNGKVLGQSKQFSVQDVEVLTATTDLDEVVSYRAYKTSHRLTAAATDVYKRIEVDLFICNDLDHCHPLSAPIQPFYHTPVEEIALGPACWLWDYLKRSGMSGFLLPLSGGIDSSSVACIVASMCHMVNDGIKNGDVALLDDLQSVVKDPSYMPANTKALCRKLFVTVYMGSQNSSQDTRKRAQALASDIGSRHMEMDINKAVNAFSESFSDVTGRVPKFTLYGGSSRENLALQNLQARCRMVTSYMLAQLELWTQDDPGSLLVLASANTDESLVGYMTKYDCSSADLNPIGGISKKDLRLFVKYCIDRYAYTALIPILNAPPSAELEPLKNGVLTQCDEDDIGLTYDELSRFGELRKNEFCGPYSMFCKLLAEWKDKIPPTEIANKVKLFFRKYAINRHKMTVLTPSYHAEDYSPDDNRFDMRPFLYRVDWPWQFKRIDATLQRYERENKNRFQQKSFP